MSTSTPPRRNRTRLWLPLAAAAACAVSLAGSASAQSGSKNEKTWGEPPKVPAPDKNKIKYEQFGIAALLGGLILVVSLIPSKRGHQD